MRSEKITERSRVLASSHYPFCDLHYRANLIIESNAVILCQIPTKDNREFTVQAR